MTRMIAVRRAVALAAALGSALGAGAARAQVPQAAPAAPPAPAAVPPPSAPSTMALPAHTTSLADAVALALRQNVDALESESEVHQAEATREGARGSFLPKLHVDANVQVWDRAFALPVAFGTFSGSFPLHDQVTWSFSPSLIQPLTGLWAIYDKYKIADYGVDVAALKLRVTLREVAFQAAQGYYRLLEAQRLSEVAEASVARLEANQKIAQSQFTNGVIGKNDLLRQQLALDNAKQRLIQTRGGIIVARGQINTILGRAADAEFEPVPFDGDPPAVPDGSLQSAESRATGQRLELGVIDRSIAQADHDKAAATKKYLPQVNAVGNYTHLGGQPFSEENAGYVGLFASWDVWDWGATQGGIDEANERLEQARIARRKVEDQVRLEAREAFVNAETARQALGVARSAVDQAEENYRIVSKKFEANAATSFDVVDAEGLLTEAHGQAESALYDYLIARAALERATGTPLPGER